MKLKPSLEKKSFIAIFIVVVALLIFCIALFLSPSFLENEKAENMTLDELNETLTTELAQMKIRGGLVTRREIDEDQKVITLYEIHMDEDQISELQSKQLGGWKVIVLPDTDYLDEMKTAEAEVIELGKDHPELKIVGSSMVSGDKEIEIWVSGSSPENEALEGKVIHGWTIHIYVCSTPPPTEQV